MIDITLCYPKPTLDSPRKGPALSIFYPGAYLEQRGFNVEYFDERFDSVSRLKRLARDSEFIGVSSMTGVQILNALNILKIAKAENEFVITVGGGVHPTLMPLQTLENSLIDFVIVGEGEKPLYNLLNLFKNNIGVDDEKLSNIKGLGLYKSTYSDGKVSYTASQGVREPLMRGDEVPFPMTDKSKPYFKIAAKSGEMTFPSSRGCPSSCNFCFNQVFSNSKWRPIPLDKWLEEFNILKTTFKFKTFYMGDDNIGKSLKRINAIGNSMLEDDIEWHTNIRPDYLNNEMVSTLDSKGCKSLLLGIESGSDRVLSDVIGKKLKNGVEDIKTAARNLNNSDISAIYSFMTNLPTETWEEVLQSMDLADWIARHDKNSRISFYVYAPYPGTKLYYDAVENGFPEPKSLEEWSKISLSNDVNPVSENIYYISGLNFRGKAGDNTDHNFPGWKRLLIKPFEVSSQFRWKHRYYRYFDLEKKCIKELFKYVS